MLAPEKNVNKLERNRAFGIAFAGALIFALILGVGTGLFNQTLTPDAPVQASDK